MPDYLDGTFARDYFAISGLAKCDLAVAHEIIGTPKPKRSTIAMEMGTALEPVINRELRNKGLTLAFADEEQLEVAGDDPYRIGHPDGLVYLESPNDLSHWLRTNLPSKAIEKLLAGDTLLLEDKTMGDSVWRQFIRSGFAGGAFIKQYLIQVNGYTEILMDPDYDEIWPDHQSDTGPHGEPLTRSRYVYGSNSFRDWLKSTGRPRPSGILAVGFNTSVKSDKGLAFEYLDYDPQIIKNRLLEVEVIAAGLHRGQLPPPSYDGRAPDCFLCSYAQICPATQKLAAELDLNDLPIASSARLDEGELDELGIEYNNNSEEIKALSARQAILREQLMDKFTEGGGYHTDLFRFKRVEVRGRESIDAKALDALAEEHGFMIPKKRSKGYTSLYVTPKFGPTHDDKKGED